MSFCPNKIFPLSTLYWPIIVPYKVDLPDPFGPTNPIIYPGYISKFIFFNTGLPLKDLLTPLTCKAGLFFLNFIILKLFFIKT